VVKKADIVAEGKRYQSFIDDITAKAQGAADQEKGPLVQKKTDLEARLQKMIAKVQKGAKKPIQSEEELQKAMSIFEKSKFKKLGVKIKDLDNRISSIQGKYDAVAEKNTKPIYQAQKEMRFLLKQEELIENPSRLISFATELSTDLLRLEQKPDFEAEIKRKWNVLQEAVGALLDSAQDLTQLKAQLAPLRNQNEIQLENDQFDLTDLQALLPTVKGNAQQQLQVQLDAKAQKLKVRSEFNDLLEGIIEKIPQPKEVKAEAPQTTPAPKASPAPQVNQAPQVNPTPKVIPAPQVSPAPDAQKRPANVRFAEMPKSKVAKRVEFFEKLASENLEKEGPKGPRKK
jgi:hypothetical protein